MEHQNTNTEASVFGNQAFEGKGDAFFKQNSLNGALEY
jgi:hypothetical protein